MKNRLTRGNLLATLKVLKKHPRPKTGNPVPASVQAIVPASNPQPKKSKELARAIAERRDILSGGRSFGYCLSARELALLERLATLHDFRMPYSGEQYGELFIHWFYRDRSADRLSRCEIFHLNMLQYFNVLDRIEVIHIRCAARNGMTGAMKQAFEILSGGKAKVDFWCSQGLRKNIRHPHIRHEGINIWYASIKQQFIQHRDVKWGEIK